jgi:hypothetical protein
LAPEPEPGLLFLNSADRVLTLDQAGKVVRDTGVIAGLNPGGGTFGSDGRYYVGLRDARTVLALPPDLKSSGEHVLPPKGTTRSSPFQVIARAPFGWSRTRS